MILALGTDDCKFLCSRVCVCIIRAKLERDPINTLKVAICFCKWFHSLQRDGVSTAPRHTQLPQAPEDCGMMDLWDHFSH